MDETMLFILRAQLKKQSIRLFLRQIQSHRPSTSTDTQNYPWTDKRQPGELGHDHPLTLYDQPNDGGGEVPCDGCLLPLSGAVYICKRCMFGLHKSCAELPETIIHFLHPKHPLTLFTMTPYKNISPSCDSCADKIWGFIYHCSLCDFDLDIKCVLLQQIVESEGHQHSFKLLRTTSFTCDACGKMSNGISCICSTCHFWVHKSCASLPPTIKHVGHDHPLSLLDSIPLYYNTSCNACDKDVDTSWCYCCESCDYIAHLDCVTSETKLGDECNELGAASVPKECTIDLISNDVNEISLTKVDIDVNEVSLTKIERVTELQHSSHKHSLTLNNDEPAREEICDGCAQTISAPFYNCAQCSFFLHISCAELPNMIQLHLLHPHALTLFAYETEKLILFRCKACLQFFNGFAYLCEICKFYIDVRCISISGTLRHEAHEHTLTLNQKQSESKCNACGVHCDAKFRCEACDFNLDLRCAALPSSARYEWDKHPLKLTFHNIEHKSGQYYCDICEEERDTNHWFYYCEDCDFTVHPQCLLGKHMMIKYGKSYESDQCPHLLTLVKDTRLPHRSGKGNDCNHEEEIDMQLLECADCNVHDHG